MHEVGVKLICSYLKYYPLNEFEHDSAIFHFDIEKCLDYK